MKVAHVLYPGFTALDVVGAFQVFAGAPGTDPVFVALERGAVADDTGHCPLLATQSVADVARPDVVLVPGSDDGSEPDRAVLAWLQRVHVTAGFTLSVGTGSLFLAAAGLLQGGVAATHWASADKLLPFCVAYSDGRVVRHGKIITAAGSSAGIDLALTVVGLTTVLRSRRRCSWPSSTTPNHRSTQGRRPPRRPRSARWCTSTTPTGSKRTGGWCRDRPAAPAMTEQPAPQPIPATPSLQTPACGPAQTWARA